METMQDSSFLERKRSLLNYAHGFYIDPTNHAGGLALWWVNNVTIWIISSSNHCIHVEVENDQKFLCSFIYAPCITVDRNPFWNEVSNLRNQCNEPWLLIGDFNSICFNYEKEGGNTVTVASTAPFRNFMFNNNLLDLGFQGDPFTWSNGRQGNDHIKERLDRAISNNSWRILFDRAIVFHEPAIGSDHCPIYINTRGYGRKNQSPFRFDARWLSESACTDIVSRSWNQDGDHNSLLNKCRSDLKS
ncbi:hypothetical protein LINGRAPRIM_LOCUS458 [Linum grandiflorum]